MFPEGFRKIAGTFKTAAVGNLQNRQIGIFQKNTGSGESVADQKLNGGKPQNLLKTAQTFSFRDTGVFSQL